MIGYNWKREEASENNAEKGICKKFSEKWRGGNGWKAECQ